METIQKALQVAIDAAREAGALLLAEMQRPDGPRGEPGKAPIDAVAEDVIRARIVTAFPTHGFRAEERIEANRVADEGCPFTWLIDPNDGTAAFQQGYRGATVSIAMLRDKTPVLGVILAYAAPDDSGDLLAWAEDCGPLTRNGAPVVRAAFPEKLRSSDVVLISNAADYRPLLNASAVQPARYRPAPGIAYRLALAAAGEGQAAVSLFGARDFDFAAGHALLRGVGGTVIDEEGREVDYHPTRMTRVRFCFGGGAEVVAQLVDRDWQEVLDGANTPSKPYERIRPGHSGALEPAQLTRAQGCWLGQLVGDALGSHVEFESPERIAKAWPDGVRTMLDGGTHDTLAGQPTDDSELALLLGRTLVGAGDYDADQVATAYGWWLKSRPFDIGNTIHKALAAFDAQRPAASLRTAANRDSQANGAMMRAAPIGIAAVGWTEERAVECARADAALTHPHPVCQDANVVFVLAIKYAIETGADGSAVYAYVAERATALTLHPDVLATIADAADGTFDDFMTHQGWVRLALQNALWLAKRDIPLETALIQTIGRGGDTDTTACIAGALLGAIQGRAAIPRPWFDAVITCRPITGLPKVRRPRPPAFWPVDALILPERLMVIP